MEQLAVAIVYLLIGIFLGLASIVAEASQAIPPSTTPFPSPELAIPEIVVAAPEPRYVAPTRRDRIGRIWAPVLINGKGPFRLVLDTGASNSAIIGEVADMLEIPVNEAALIRVNGITGSAVVPAIAIRGLQVGDLSIDTTRLPVVADVFGGAEGVLGYEGLAERRIRIDFARDSIVIARSHGERAGYGFTTVPFELTRGRLLTLDVRIGATRVTAIIDTGAQKTLGNRTLLEVLTRRLQNSATPQDIVGVTLDVARGDRISIPPISIGSLQIRGASVTFGDMFIFNLWSRAHEPILVIGMDVLGLFDTLIIDYKMQELQVRLPR